MCLLLLLLCAARLKTLICLLHNMKWGAGIAFWYTRRQTRDRKVASSSPGRSGGRIFSPPQRNFYVDSYSVSILPGVNEVARKRPRSFYQKCRWQVSRKRAHTLEPTKSEWADSVVQAHCGNLPGKRAQTKLVREHSATVVSAR